MNITEKTNLLNALKRSTVQVTFKKINTEEIRIMPCTLKEEILRDNGVTGGIIKDFNPDSDHFAAWALDKNAWRSFRLDTVVSWEVVSE